MKGALPVTAATQEPHDLPGGLILPFCEQTTSVGDQGEKHEGLTPWDTSVEAFILAYLSLCCTRAAAAPRWWGLSLPNSL